MCDRLAAQLEAWSLPRPDFADLLAIVPVEEIDFVELHYGVCLVAAPLHQTNALRQVSIQIEQFGLDLRM